jgi:phosphatidylserine decarboxylase
VGNFVAVTRGPNPQKEFESMPIYARLGMHLLFVGHPQEHVLKISYVEKLFKEQSAKQGALFDSTQGALEHIQSFVKEYDLEGTLDQLVKPNLTDYKTFNEFFSREIKPEARPIDGAGDPSIITSVADCRLAVFNDVAAAKEFWVKDHTFTVGTLLEDKALSDQIGAEPSIAIFRLAPADYHRWHSPVDAVLGPTKHLPGQYYTVNPQAVNEDFTVFTANRRDINVLSWSNPADPGAPAKPVIVVAVGALLVGAITWIKSQGEACKKGEPQGYFAYGGSTVIALFPKGSVEWDSDLLTNSMAALETKVAVGNRIGKRV